MPPSPAPSIPGAASPAGGQPDVEALTDEAEALLRAGRVDDAVLKARAAAMGSDLERSWRILALAGEAQGDFATAFMAYTQAMALGADVREIGAGLGRAAVRVGEFAVADDTLSRFIKAMPATPEVIVDLARAQTQLHAFERAHATLRSALERDAGQAAVWLALGELLCLEGRHGQANVFFEEAERLAPGSAAARSGSAEALLLGGGDVDRALAVSEQALALASPAEIAEITAAHARRLLIAGRLPEGWTALARGMERGPAAVVDNKVSAPAWTPDIQREGRLLILGEPNVMNELLMAQALPDLLAVEPTPILAVSAHWAALARRSFPQAKVVPLLTRSERGRTQQAADLDGPHLHEGQLVGAWRSLRSLMTSYRSEHADFAGATPYLKPDQQRVADWREWLSTLGPGPKVGIRWRQPLADLTRPDEVPALTDLRRALSVPRLNLVTLQDGEIMGETIWIQDALGLQLHEPPGLNRDDLDDVAALACALDLVVGLPGSTTYVAAACGAETWFLSPPGHWAMLGTDGYPWFANSRVMAGAPDGSSDAIGELREALLERVVGSAGR